MRGVAIFGSTGSVGCSALSVLEQHQNQYNIIALTANSNYERLLHQCRQFKPQYAVILDKQLAHKLHVALSAEQLNTVVLSEQSDLLHIAGLPEVNIVVSAIMGSHGLLPTIQAVSHGKTVLIANKESLVMAGELIMDLARQKNATILPIDSEHSAILQSLPHDYTYGNHDTINRVILTASGGPLYHMHDLHNVTLEQALNHPTWCMGKKITIDCSTMMNKGLEIIEAKHLFGIPFSKLDILIHPQSIIHSMVEYIDGSTIAQLSAPDMSIPIAYALAYPNRISLNMSKLDLTRNIELTFAPPNYKKFPCLTLALQAASDGGSAPVILNAANEVAVEAFLNNRIKFHEISHIVDATINNTISMPIDNIDAVLAAHKLATHNAHQVIYKFYRNLG